jgi:hypothetical protein
MHEDLGLPEMVGDRMTTLADMRILIVEDS